MYLWITGLFQTVFHCCPTVPEATSLDPWSLVFNKRSCWWRMRGESSLWLVAVKFLSTSVTLSTTSANPPEVGQPTRRRSSVFSRFTNRSTSEAQKVLIWKMEICMVPVAILVWAQQWQEPQKMYVNFQSFKKVVTEKLFIWKSIYLHNNGLS